MSVFQKYTVLIVNGDVHKQRESSLLDFGCTSVDTVQLQSSIDSNKSETIDVLTDIFTSNAISSEISADVLQPTTVVKEVAISASATEKTDAKCNNRLKAFEELDALGETLLKQNLSAVKLTTQFNK